MIENYYMFCMKDDEYIVGPSDWVMVKSQRLIDHFPFEYEGWAEEQLEHLIKQSAISCEADPFILALSAQEALKLSFAEIGYEMEGAFGYDA